MKIIVIVLLCFTNIVKAQNQVDVYFTISENYFDTHEQPHEYMLANDVRLRSKPKSRSKQIELLKIGQPILILKKSKNIDTINGIKSYWYQVKTISHTGWVWGGYIATRSFGSETDTGIKFVFGLNHIKKEDGWTKTYYQLRAFKDTVELDKTVFYAPLDYIDIKSFGSKGLDLDDIVSIHIPCVGGCGCTTGNIIYFWNGEKFSEKFELFGIADAWASEYKTMIFPTDMDGKNGKIIKTSVYFIDSVGEDKVKRKKVIEQFIWTGNRLIMDNTFKKQIEVYVVDQ